MSLEYQSPVGQEDKGKGVAQRYALLASCIEVIEQKLRHAARMVEESAITLSAEFTAIAQQAGQQREQIATLQRIMDTLPEAQRGQVQLVLREMEVNAADMDKRLAAIVTEMQFQDRNSQYIDNACGLLEELLSLYGDSTDLVPSDEMAGYCQLILDKVRLHEFRTLLVSMFARHGLLDAETAEREATQSAGGEDADDIELF